LIGSGSGLFKCRVDNSVRWEDLHLHTITGLAWWRLTGEARIGGRGCRLKRPRGVSGTLGFARAAGHTVDSMERRYNIVEAEELSTSGDPLTGGLL